MRCPVRAQCAAHALAAAVGSAGAGNIAAAALIAPAAMGTARRLGIPAFPMALMVAHGAIAGGMSPFGPGGVVVAAACRDRLGLPGAEWAIFAHNFLANAVVGFAGLPVTLAALNAGKRLALANKESLIAGGPVVQAVRSTPGAEIVPVDSEHSALHQCLRAGRAAEVARLLLTASGGPFFGRSAEELAGVSVEDALAHPTWQMGPKVTIDSSTLMNKGLEVIEAHELFGVPYDRIEVVVQPQSVVHSMVEFCDGSTVAQLSLPDMRLPIGYALAYPERPTVPFGAVDWGRLGRLDFALPDTETFRCLALAYQAGRAGGTAPATLNAANEVAVAAFLEGRIGFLDIVGIVEGTLGRLDPAPADSLEAVLALDADARAAAASLVQGLA